MANHHAITSVGDSLVTYLQNAFPADMRAAFPDCQFLVVSSNEMNTKFEDFGTAVTLYLHRVAVDPYLRNVSVDTDPVRSHIPVSLDLHYLLTIWAPNALAEHTILGWVVRELYTHQALSQSDLIPGADWTPDDVIQVIPGEISNEDMMRIWDAVEPPYHLSLSYIARVVRISPKTVDPSLPVVARRLYVDEIVETP